MRTRDKTNPLEGKTRNENYEPWLTWREALFELKAMNLSYSKWKSEMLKRRQ